MSPANRVRLIVGLLAVLAAGIVGGVVFATRQSPPQPRAQCKERPKPFIVPGTPTTNVAAVRAALAQKPVAAARALEQLAFEAPNDPVVQFNYGTTLYCAGYIADAVQAFRAAKQAGRDTFYEIQSDVLLHPQYFPRAIRPSSPARTNPLLVRGAIFQRQGHQQLRRAGVDEGRPAPPGERRSAGGGGRGALRYGQSFGGFFQARAARPAIPEEPVGAVPPRPTPRLDGPARPGDHRVSLARSLGPKTALGKEANTFLGGLVTGGLSAP